LSRNSSIGEANRPCSVTGFSIEDLKYPDQHTFHSQVVPLKSIVGAPPTIRKTGAPLSRRSW
jgi:hypothetical protein